MVKRPRTFRSVSEIRNHLKNYLSSGLSRSDYCQINNLPPTNLTTWLSKRDKYLNPEGSCTIKKLSNSPFIAVPVSSTTVKPCDYHLHLGNQLHVSIPSNFDSSSLSQLLSLLHKEFLDAPSKN